MLSVEPTNNFDVRRERVFLVLAGFFLCAMSLLNVIGITRFVELGPLSLAVGVLPYPLTFLCTDLVSELYGKRRANFLVTVGLVMNIFIIFIMSIASSLPSVQSESMPPWQLLRLAEDFTLPSGELVSGSIELFDLIYSLTSGAVLASMIAYIAAQYCDVYLFHFWKRLTKGRHLWLRNNCSTLISQGVDSFAVVSVTFGAAFLNGMISLRQVLVLIGSSYAFKVLVALFDTIPLYILVRYLTRYLKLDAAQPN